MNLLDELPTWDGLLPNYVPDVTSGSSCGLKFSLGGLGDSYYEYLLKQWVQVGGNNPRYRR